MKSFLIHIRETKGGLAFGMTVDELAKRHKVSIDHIQNQLNMGIKIEKEHTKSIKTALSIAKDHVYEDPNYYTKLKKIESAPVNNVGDGNIAGIAPGEAPPVRKKVNNKKYWTTIVNRNFIGTGLVGSGIRGGVR